MTAVLGLGLRVTGFKLILIRNKNTISNNPKHRTNYKRAAKPNF